MEQQAEHHLIEIDSAWHEFVYALHATREQVRLANSKHIDQATLDKWLSDYDKENN